MNCETKLVVRQDVAPFGYAHDVTIIVDNAIYTYDKILITPGVPEFTIELSTEELKRFY